MKQRRRALNVEANSTSRKRKHDGALVSWLSCGECGCRITYEPKRKGERIYHYYRCTNGRGAHRSLQYVAEGQILSAFEPALAAISLSEQRAREISEALNRTHPKAMEAKRAQLDGYRAALVALEHGEDELYSLLRRGVLDDEGYRRQLERIRAERRRFTTLAKTLWNEGSASERRAFLEKLLSNPRWDGVSACWDYKKPWGTVAEISKASNWRPQG